MTKQEKTTILSALEKNFSFNINKGIVDFKIQDIVDNPELFDFDVFLPTKGINLQRPLVWTDEKKESLIITLLKGENFGTFTVVRHDPEDGSFNKRYEVIDGKQRLTTIVSYIKDEFPVFVGGHRFYYSDLPDDYQKKILYTYCIVDVAYSYESEPITDGEKISLFEHVNWLGTPQDKEHMEKLRGVL